MADIQSNININIDTSTALANLKNLQREISAFQRTMSQSTAANQASANNLQRSLLGSINATGQFSASITKVKSSADSFTTALEKNKLSLGEYFRYAGASSKTFGRMFTNEFNTIEKVARERVKTLATQYIKLGRDANGAITSMSVRPLVLDMESLATKTAMAAQKQQIMNQLLKQGSTNLLNFGKNTQWAGRQLMVGFTVPLTMLGTQAAKTFMQMEEQALKFKRVYGDTFTATEETDAMLKQIKALSTEFTKYGVAVADTMELAATAAASGKMGADLLAQVSEATRLSVLGGVEQAQALETTISVTNAFGVAAEDLAGKINFLNAVENQTVTSIEDLTIAIPKAGPVIKQLGGDVEDLSFFLTAMKEGGINASEGANALKSGLASMINPTAKASEFLAGFGINLKGIVEANRGDVKGTVVEFAKALDTLDPLNRAQAIEQLFGKFQFARLSTLFKNVIAEGSQAERVLKLTSASATELAILSEREMKRIEDSPMFKFKKAFEDLKTALAPVGEAFLKAVTPFINFGTDLLKKFNELDEGGKSFIIGLTTLLGAIGPIAIMAFGLLANGVAQIIKGFIAVRSVFQKAGSSSKTLGEQTDYMSQQQLEAAAAAASLDQSHNKLAQTFSIERAALEKLTAAYRSAISAQAAYNVSPIPTTFGKNKSMKLAGGVSMVPGSGTGDTVPAMLTPGEAIIPAPMAKKYRGLIQGMISGNIPGFSIGTDEVVAADDISNLRGQSVSTYGNTVQILPKSFDGVNVNKMAGQGIADRDTYTAALKSVGAKSYAPFLVEMASEILGPKATDEAITTLASSDKFKSFASKLSDGVVEGLAKNVGKVGDREYHAMASEKAASLANSPEFAGAVGDAAKTVLSRDTAFEDATSKRVSLSSGNVKPIGRRQLLRDVPHYENPKRRNLYQKLYEKMGGTMQPQEYELSHFAAPGTRDASDLAATEGKSTVLSRALARMRRGETWLSKNKFTGKGGKYVPSSSSNEELRAMAGVPATQPERDVLVAERAAKAKKVATDLGTQAAQARVDAEKAVLAKEQNDPIMLQRSKKRNSPHPQAAIDGRDDARARVTAARKETERLSRADKYAANLQSNYSGAQVVTGQMRAERKQVEKLMKQDRYEARQRASQERIARQAEARRNNSIQSVYGGNFTAQQRQERKRQEQATKQANAAAARERKAQARQQAAALQQQRVAEEKLAAKQQRTAKRQAALSKLKPSRGAMMGGTMALSSIAMGASMMGGPVGDIANQVMGPMMAITGVASALSMLPGPIGIVVGALVGLGSAVALVIASHEAEAKSALELADSTTTSFEEIRQASAVTGKVSSTELRQKSQSLRVAGFATTKKQANFGEQFISSEAGQGLVSDVTAQKMAGSSSASIGKNIGARLAMQVAQGILTSSEADGIAAAIGQKVGDQSITASITGQLDKILGPDGKDLATNPLKVTVAIVQEGQAQAETTFESGYDPETRTVDTKKLKTGAQQGLVAYGQNQQALDVINSSADAAIREQEANLKSAKTDKDRKAIAKEIADIEAKRTLDLQTQVNVNNQSFEDQKRYKKGVEETGGNYQVDVIKKSVDEIYKNASQLEKDFANQQLDEINKLEESDFKTRVQVQFGSAELNPSQVQKILKLGEGAGGEGFKTNYELLVSTSGDAKTSELIDTLSAAGFKDADIQVKVAFAASNEGGLDTILTGVNDMKDLEIDLKTDAGQTQLNSYISALQKIKDATKDGPITTEIINSVIGNEKVSAAIWANKEFQKLPKSQQLAYVAQYKAIMNLEGVEPIKSMFAEWGSKPENKGKNFQDFATYLAGKSAVNNVTTTTPEPYVPPAGPTGPAKEDILKPVLQNLKEFVNSSIKATGSFKELLRVLGKGKEITSFGGLQSALLAAGATPQTIDYLVTLTAKERARFVVWKNGKVVFTEAGKALQKAYNAAAIGDFMQKQRVTIQNVKNQATAANKLVVAGMAYADAWEAVQDAAFAAAIAASKNRKEVAKIVKLFNQAKAAVKTYSSEVEQAATVAEDLGDVFGRQSTVLNAQFNIDTKKFQEDVALAEADINKLQYSLDDWQAQLQEISWKEDEINDKYDKRFEALDKVKDLNAELSAQEKDKLTIADALSRGDIASAAKAIQDARARQAQANIESQRKTLESAKEKELAAVRSSSGNDRAKINKEILSLEKQIFKIEESRLEPAQESIRLKQVDLDKALFSLGQQQSAWDVLNTSIQNATKPLQTYNELLKEGQSILDNALTTEPKPTKPGTKFGQESTAGDWVWDGDTWEKYNTNPKISGKLVGPDTAGSKFGQISKDGNWVWNGITWLKTITDGSVSGVMAGPDTPGSKAGQISSDKKWKWTGKTWVKLAKGGMVPSYLANGGFPGMPSFGTDKIPAMLTPGEFVVKKYAVDNFGAGNLKAINNGTFDGGSVYNYNLSVNMTGSNLSANDVANTVMAQIQRTESQRLRGNRLNGN